MTDTKEALFLIKRTLDALTEASERQTEMTRQTRDLVEGIQVALGEWHHDQEAKNDVFGERLQRLAEQARELSARIDRIERPQVSA